jgi:hypothetical protein
VPGARLVIEKRNPNASLVVRIEGQKQAVRLSDELASHIAIEQRK